MYVYMFVFMYVLMYVCSMCLGANIDKKNENENEHEKDNENRDLSAFRLFIGISTFPFLLLQKDSEETNYSKLVHLCRSVLLSVLLFGLCVCISFQKCVTHFIIFFVCTISRTARMIAIKAGILDETIE